MSTQSEQQETIITPSKPTPSTSSNTPLDTDVTPLSEAQIKKLLEDAEELKQEGNGHFRAGKWNEALVAYQSALGRLPKRKQKKGNDRDSMKEVDDVEKEGEGTDTEGSHKEEGASETEPEEVTPLQAECAKARSVLNANLAACHVKLDEHSEVVSACTEALRDDPDYVKALQRRAASNEILDTWASLASAQEDYTKLLTLLPSSSSQYIEARRKLAAVKPRAEAAQKKETSEMLDKLKGIGNSILGNFGLSTNNFQFTPNGQGGYSMNFVR